jgi:hypothetical protein
MFVSGWAEVDFFAESVLSEDWDVVLTAYSAARSRRRGSRRKSATPVLWVGAQRAVVTVLRAAFSFLALNLARVVASPPARDGAGRFGGCNGCPRAARVPPLTPWQRGPLPRPLAQGRTFCP